jgi:hypothetical protein
MMSDSNTNNGNNNSNSNTGSSSAQLGIFDAAYFPEITDYRSSPSSAPPSSSSALYAWVRMRLAKSIRKFAAPMRPLFLSSVGRAQDC